MVKYLLIFLAGCVFTLAVDVALSFRPLSAALKKSGSTAVRVTIHVVGDPSHLLSTKSMPELLDRIKELPADEKKKILDGISSGFVTELEFESNTGNGSSSLIVSAAGGPSYMISSSGKLKSEEKK